ncbi:MAG: S-layer homology domain-containing protein, partial [Bacillota bacterium]
SVSGRVSEASIVKINGIMAALSDELIFNANIPLMEASNNLLVEATDLSGNTATSYMNVNYDMSNDKAAPVITLDQAGGTVSQPSYTISGRVNEYSSIKIGSEAADLTSNLTFTKTITLSPGSNVIKVEAVDPAQNKSELSIQVNYQQPAPPPPPQSGGQDTTIIQIPPSPIPGVSFDNGVIEVNPKLENGGVAVVKLEASDLTKAFEKAEEDEYGNKTVTIKASYVKGATKYNCTLPNDVLTAGRQKLVEIRTPAGNVVLPGNMFGKNELADTDEVTISIGFADILVLSADMEQKIADRPAIELNVLVNGKIIEWNNPYAPAAVSVDYDAKAYELEDSEHIVVWSIDESGNIKTVPNGKYNKDTKKVTFTTTCSGKYTVSFVKRSFKDISKYSWASKQIEVLASKGIVNGTSESTFTPGSNITRADFMIMLVKALGLNAKIEANFNDVKKTDYYYEAVGIARQLGITSGVGNNNFLPKDPIKREDMMVFVEKALKIANKVESEGSLADLKRFDDTSDISSYALKSIAALVREGIVSGNGTKINPKSYTTRAEVAALIYKIYSK